MNGYGRDKDIDHEMWDLYEEWPGQRYGYGAQSAPGPSEETLRRHDYESGRLTSYSIPDGPEEAYDPYGPTDRWQRENDRQRKESRKLNRDRLLFGELSAWIQKK